MTSPATEMSALPSGHAVAVQLTGVTQPLFIGVSSRDAKKILKRNKFNVNNITPATLKNSVMFVMKVKEARVLTADGFDFESGILVAKPYFTGQKEIAWISMDEDDSSDSDEDEVEDVNLDRDNSRSAAPSLNPNSAQAMGIRPPLETTGTSISVGSLIGILGAFPSSSDTMGGQNDQAMAEALTGHLRKDATVEDSRVLEANLLNQGLCSQQPGAYSHLSSSSRDQTSGQPAQQNQQPRPPPKGNYKKNPLCNNAANSRACDYVFDSDENVVDISLFSDPKTYECELVGWFSGSQPVSNFLLSILQKQWDAPFQCNATKSGWHVFKFQSVEAKLRVLNNGPYVIKNRTLSLQELTPTFQFKPMPEHLAPVWVKLFHIPFGLWNPRAIGILASRLGPPMEVDVLTEEMRLLNYAKVLVRLDLTKEPVNSIHYDYSDDLGDFDIKVQYLNLPLYCKKCKKIGHVEDGCPPEGSGNTGVLSYAAAARNGRARTKSRPRAGRQGAAQNVESVQTEGGAPQNRPNTETIQGNTQPVEQDVQISQGDDLADNGAQQGEGVVEVVAQETGILIQGPRTQPTRPDGPFHRGRSRRRRSNSRNTSSRAMFMTGDGVLMPSTDDGDGDGFVRVTRPWGNRRINGWRSFGMRSLPGEGNRRNDTAQPSGPP